MPNAQPTCPHIKEIRQVKPSGKGCKECLEMGDTWVHLRECLICGHVGCCDSSKNKHATPTTQLCSPLNPARTGVGAMWTKCF
jgi:hypothetical protein